MGIEKQKKKGANKHLYLSHDVALPFLGRRPKTILTGAIVCGETIPNQKGLFVQLDLCEQFLAAHMP